MASVSSRLPTDAASARLSRATPVVRPAPTGSGRAWQLGSLHCDYGEHAAGAAPSGGAELLVPVGQPLHLDRGGVPLILRAPFDLLYLPSRASDAQPSAFHGWRLRLDAKGVRQLGGDGRRVELERIRPLQPQQPERRQLSTNLRQLLNLARDTPAAGQSQLVQAGLDQCILRLLAMLLCCDQPWPTAAIEAPASLKREQVFDDLLQWIRSQLDRPIRLQELEQRSGYSQRSLRNFFQRRFGCSPQQWIRRQRLEAARAQLLDAEPGTTVTAISAEWGYPHPAQFSRDMQRVLQVKPSELLREGLRRRTISREAPRPPAAASAGSP